MQQSSITFTREYVKANISDFASTWSFCVTKICFSTVILSIKRRSLVKSVEGFKTQQLTLREKKPMNVVKQNKKII